jgi:hypothetical protein
VRIHLEDRLRGRGDASGTSKQPFKLALGAVLGGDEYTALSVSRSEARTSATASPSVALMKAMKSVVAPSHPEAVDGNRGDRGLDAAGAEAFQMGRIFEPCDVVAGKVVDGRLVLLERNDVVLTLRQPAPEAVATIWRVTVAGPLPFVVGGRAREGAPRPWGAALTH